MRFCPDIVQDAYLTTREMCADTGRNQACYGHDLLEAEQQPDIEDFKFDQEGDKVNVAALRSLRLSAMNVGTGEWGVALLRLRAGITDSGERRSVTLLLFGDVQIENAADSPAVTLTVTPATGDPVPLLAEPFSAAEQVGELKPGDIGQAVARTEDGSWMRVVLSNDEAAGWVFRPLVFHDGNADQLQVADATVPFYGSMQAFFLSSGMDDSQCAEAPDSGLLIQTPDGVAKVTLLINEVDVQLGSTVYFQSEPGREMRVTVVEGSATVKVGDVAYEAVAGSEISVAIDENSHPIAPPAPPKPYNPSELQALPLEQLEREVTIAPPVSPTPTRVLPTFTPRTSLTPTQLPTSSPTATLFPTEAPSATLEPTFTPTLPPTFTPLPTPTETATLPPLPSETNTPQPTKTEVLPVDTAEPETTPPPRSSETPTTEAEPQEVPKSPTPTELWWPPTDTPEGYAGPLILVSPTPWPIVTDESGSAVTTQAATEELGYSDWTTPSPTVTPTNMPPGLQDNPGLEDDLPPGHGGSPPGQN